MRGLVLSVPHASIAVPATMVPPFDPQRGTAWLRAQSDAFTDEIYDVPTARRVVFPWSRFVLDPNRHEGQESEGGVVPIRDFDEVPLHRPGEQPDAAERRRRIEHLHRPYHLAISSLLADPATRLFIDCHSCAPVGPERSPDPGAARPDAVLSNGGGRSGEALTGPLSCGPTFLRECAERLSHHLLEHPAPAAAPGAAVRGTTWLNHPFPGGAITQRHADALHGVPGFQIELNQRLWVDDDGVTPLPGRISWLRGVVSAFFADALSLAEGDGARL